MNTEAQLEDAYPWIPWRDPVTVQTPAAGTEFGCRFCIAIFGLKGEEVPMLPKTREEFDTHMKEMHTPLNQLTKETE